VTEAELIPILRRLLAGIAPESDPGAVDADADLRAALDIDSMDFLGFLAAVHRHLGVAVPESDYAEVATLAGCAAYLAARGAAAASA